MKAKRRVTKSCRPGKGSLVQCIRKFLTPALWKQAEQQRNVRKRSSRWRTQPLVLMLLFTTWCCGDSQGERFETARAFCVVCMPRRRRPGNTVQGFQNALAKLPMCVLRVLAEGIRFMLTKCLWQRWYEDGFIPIGCDGSRVECPRSEELEEHLGEAGKDGSAPTIWVTALVLLRKGVPWAWRWGKGTASERGHLEKLIRFLPEDALLVADAGYVGFELARRLIKKNVCFLIRMSSCVTLYRDKHDKRVSMKRFREGLVYYWPTAAQRGGQRPLQLRLLRIRSQAKKNGKGDVWLLTNVMEANRLSVATAARYYRWRWENEGQFRAYKHTLKKVKLVSRTLRLVHREAEGAMLAMQLMLAQAVRAIPAAKPGEVENVCSPRKVLLAVRREMLGQVRRGFPKYYERLQQACRETRVRRSPKQKRVWPRRKPHKPPKPPKILTLTAQQKARISRLETTAA